MTDNTEQMLRQWQRPEPSADLAARIIAQAGAVQPAARVQRPPLFRLALAASLVVALAVGYAVQGGAPGMAPPMAAAPAPAPLQLPVQLADYTINGMDMLADVEFFEDGEEFAFLDGSESL